MQVTSAWMTSVSCSRKCLMANSVTITGDVHRQNVVQDKLQSVHLRTSKGRRYEAVDGISKLRGLDDIIE
ncbi:hypothetical protein BS78_07G015600 [Paspalum vaginatum]|nr:hypothetical protein BS78_07G015600 [Paspalum vaginatum]